MKKVFNIMRTAMRKLARKLTASLTILALLLTLSAPAYAADTAQICVTVPLNLEITALYPAPLADEEEWVEITNPSDLDANLSYYTIEDTTEKPMSLEGTLAAGESTQISSLSFQLNNGGDTVTLKTTDGQILDSLSYADSTSGEAVGTTSSTTESETTDTTTDESNSESVELTSTPTIWPIFSEAIPNPEGTDSTEEWIELFNPHAETIDLSPFKIDDSEGGSSPHQLEGEIQAGEYFLIYVEDSKVSLNNSVDSIRLLLEEAVLWEVAYEDPEEGFSYALIGEDYYWSTTPTPGIENIFTSEIPSDENESEYEDGDLSEEVEITEVYPNPEGPDAEDEWIEITNGGGETVNLGNWTIDDGEGGSDPYTFPDDTIIEPGETIVIYRSESDVALNNSDEVVELSDYTGETVDEISYESSEEGMSYAEIEVEEMENAQASASGLGKRVFSTWHWTSPSPGVSNPTWQQFKGQVVNFENSALTLFDGISNWEFAVTANDLNDLVFQMGNTVLVQATLNGDSYKIMSSELIESAAKNAPTNLPLGAIASGILALTWISYEIYKKRKSKLTDFA